ncbi:hypothetical protein BV25DRAFT_1189726 [Artomyces pyxidatus]|uniref:Uncharacterized protein n=1 Tax=Artomyces pyxidatus TaxID=48021 RepID=A0ACB8SQB3_9AGAM|nr:hypothetical protein BV25DRAFT_1189726 [Artomyces pyxidatus]
MPLLVLVTSSSAPSPVGLPPTLPSDKVGKASLPTPPTLGAVSTYYPVLTPALGPPTQVYHYQHPVTGERVTSLLPPDHPQMICLQEGRHIHESRFGLLGILAAIVWFPLGIGLCLLDRKVRCRRCGEHIDDGICG